MHESNQLFFSKNAATSSDHQTSCHETEEPKTDESAHCPGICLCAHVSSNVTVDLPPSEGLVIELAYQAKYFLDRGTLKSISPMPLTPPPKPIS